MALLAGPAAEALKFAETHDTSALERARSVLQAAARTPEEAGATDAYLEILLARTRGELREVWTEVEVVTLGLLEHGSLSADEVRQRQHCVRGIRSSLLN